MSSPLLSTEEFPPKVCMHRRKATKITPAIIIIIVVILLSCHPSIQPSSFRPCLCCLACSIPCVIFPCFHISFFILFFSKLNNFISFDLLASVLVETQSVFYIFFLIKEAKKTKIHSHHACGVWVGSWSENAIEKEW